jgi:hypothetical protein
MSDSEQIRLKIGHGVELIFLGFTRSVNFSPDFF